MRSPGHPFAIVCAFAFSICAVRSAGVAALKEQTYHRDSSARAVAYSRIIDSHGPYLRLVSGGTNIDILRSKLVGRVELPDGIRDFIMEEKDVVYLRQSLADVRKFTARYPRSAPLLEKQANAIAAHISRFDAGQLRFEGAWISLETLAGIRETRRREDEVRELADVEKVVYEAAQRENGLLLHDGKWLTKHEIEQLAPESPTELSEAIEPLCNADFDGAKFSVKNLSSLASGQTGAPKVRTERLGTVIRNLFLAESHLADKIIASTAEARAAAMQEKNAADWRKPNGFGNTTEDAAIESRRKAAEIRQRSADELASRKQELLDQLRDADIVTADFHKLREDRVALILGGAVRAVSARHFTNAEFRPGFPDESLASIRERIRGSFVR
ncbi:MAG: hypothetical protein ABIT37_11055 [Luteolibacter sp.]